MIVFDSWALLAFFQGEPAAAEIKSIIESSWKSKTRMVISVINFGEIWYSISRNQDDRTADEVCRQVPLIGIEVLDATYERVMDAAKIKKRGKLSYAHTFAASLAKELQASLLTGDTEFRVLNKEISIQWLSN